jgi:geranylgeranyl pyrophosphate synthase
LGRTDDDVIERLGAGAEIANLRNRIDAWAGTADAELREAVAWTFTGTQKHFRPLTILGCARAMGGASDSPETIEYAFVVELMHNMTLIVDDILDGSEERRGIPSLHARFGSLTALMTSGYLVAEAFTSVAGDPFAVRLLAELMRRLGSAECLQWRQRRQPLGVEDWRRIAGEDTGSMFEICAVLGARSERLRRFGHLLGVLYHGCDDVGDQRGLEALGGGGEEDLRDGILTLPVALAIRDPAIRELFCRHDQDTERLAIVAAACRRQLVEAERVLDGVAAAAKREATDFADDPSPLLELVDVVRPLSTR